MIIEDKSNLKLYYIEFYVASFVFYKLYKAEKPSVCLHSI